MAMFRKAMGWLGLVDDEFYPEEQDYYDDDGISIDPPPEPVRGRSPRPVPTANDAGPVKLVRSPADHTVNPVPRARKPPNTAASRVHVMDPMGFNDAQEVGDRLKEGQPVILNLQGVDRDLQRRLIDFASGLAYALNGTMAKAADQVFLLTPSNVEVSEEDKQQLQARGLYRAPRP